MNRTASLAPTCYFGEMFDRNGAVAILRENGHLGALWCLVSSDECALEVKNSTQVRLEDLRGLKNFGEDFPESRRWLLHRGRERLLRDGILCAPCEEFLLQLKPGEFPA
ncbi:MAG TPA: hypothetical protein DCZ69_12690 [Syntrophobacteraceae bacterium]|nr:hypothetical protein [Syntrophobacteraceae bacterium]